MPYRRLPQTNSTRDTALTTCKSKMDVTPAIDRPMNAARIAELTTDQPAYHTLINQSNVAKYNQTLQSGVVEPLRHAARLWIGHGYQALINACIREQFENEVKNLYGLTLEAMGGPTMTTDAGITQAAITYNDGEAARILAGGAPITFPDLVDINTHADAFKAGDLVLSGLKDIYDTEQEALAASNPDIDLLVLRLWNEIEAAFDTGDKPSLRRKAREWGVVYALSPGETPSGEDFSVIGTVTDTETLLPLSNILVGLVAGDGTITASDTTEDDGKFYLPPVVSDNYTLQAMVDGYLPFNLPMVVVEGELLTQDVALTPDMPPVP